ncbi:MAG: flagellar basal body-associated FliL family protein [Thermodesulfobacteriota bacterium]|nr:flagellar basal body-associated FliL family protein [Thermodesulfobacteriota bacterium]
MRLLSQMVVAGYYKKALIAICLCIALFAGSGPVRGQGSEAGGQRSEVGGRKSEVGSQRFYEERFQYFNDFIVYLKDGCKPVCRDEHGTGRKDRILVCDVVIELNRGMKLPQERIELRKIIYNTLKEPLDLHEIKKSLKEKIKSRLNNFMDDEIIKNVYFTKFILL